MIIRSATRADLDAIVELIFDDELGQTRDAPVVDEAYEKAFADIQADARNDMIVGEDDGVIVGCLQITYIPGLGRHGAERSAGGDGPGPLDRRSQGLGRELIVWAIDQAKARGCGLVQLTTDKRRQAAHRFYQRLGFVASHEGMKLTL